MPLSISGSIDLTIPTILPRQSFTPTIGGGITGSSNNTAMWWRVGQNLYMEGRVNFTGANPGSGLLTVSVPSGLTINTNALSCGSDSYYSFTSLLGSAYFFIAGAGWKFLYPVFNSTTTFYLVENTQSMTVDLFSPGDSFAYTVSVPILGW